MGLTTGSAPFGHRPAGHFDVDVPREVVYVEPFPRRVRAMVGDNTVVDSTGVQLVYVSKRLPRYSIPAGDVHLESATPDPHVPGYVEVGWNAVDAWFEEDEQVFVHVRDPYHRIDVVPTSRRVRISIDGVVLAESSNGRALYETSLPVRWYLPRDHVRMDLLERSATVTHCAYKGTPVHWSARVDNQLHDDVAWSYDDEVKREADDVRGYVCFYNERTDVEVDGVVGERPLTPWSR
jgi:uncharacterized protein (DUF427 family)